MLFLCLLAFLLSFVLGKLDAKGLVWKGSLTKQKKYTEFSYICDDFSDFGAGFSFCNFFRSCKILSFVVLGDGFIGISLTSELLLTAFFARFAAHSSLDDHLARWFGLNQSKYQWALDDYYESKGLVSR